MVTSDHHFNFPAWPQLLGDLAIRLWEAARESVALISRADEDLLIEAAFLAMEADATIRPTFDQWPDMSKEELRAVLFAAISKLSQIPESLHEQAINSVFH